jgi:ABC-type multidrug transport system fused ATPase/permease subunit
MNFHIIRKKHDSLISSINNEHQKTLNLLKEKTLTEKQARLHALEHQIKRLQKRIAIMDAKSNRIGWARVAIFFTGALLSILAYFLVGWWLLLIGVVVTLVTFSIVAYVHGRINRSITRHKIWMHIKSTHIARINLDWDSIPPAPFTELPTNHPFASDLDITGKHSLHRLINTAVLPEGSQRLQDWLLNTIPDLETILHRQALIQELTPLSIFRDKLYLKSLLSTKNMSRVGEKQKLLNWLNVQTESKLLLPLLSLSLFLSVLTITLFALNICNIIPQYWVLMLLFSILFLFVTKNQRGELFEDAYQLRDAFAQLSLVFEYLETYRYGKNLHLKALCEPFHQDYKHRPSPLLKKIARVASASTLQKNLLLWIILNVLMPWDFYFAYRFQHYKSQVVALLPVWLDVWFELEALNSLANFTYLNPEYTLPEIILSQDPDNKIIPFRACDLGHPLLPVNQKVVNNFSIPTQGEIDIITGSNMSGKSTLLRTLGINLSMAYAGGPVNASLFQTMLFRIFTCIRISDSVTEGYSYFYAEVKRLKTLMTEVEADNDLPLFFLIDEIFKGTNNRERRIGSASYISALVGRNCLGVISTHDLELVVLEDHLPNIRNYHFKEDVFDGQMVFDYLLREGPSPTTNALKIMQMEGLPINVGDFKDS